MPLALLFRVRRCLGCPWGCGPFLWTESGPGKVSSVDYLGVWDKPCGYRLDCRWPLIRLSYVDQCRGPRTDPPRCWPTSSRRSVGWPRRCGRHGRTMRWSRPSGVAQASAALAVVEAGAVVEADTRDSPRRQLHYGSTGDWLTHLGGLRHGEGKRRVRRAHALCGPMTRTRDGLVAGTVSPVQAEVIVAAVHDLPPGECGPASWGEGPGRPGRASERLRPRPGRAARRPRSSTPTPPTGG